jgi:hypothetical protein
MPTTIKFDAIGTASPAGKFWRVMFLVSLKHRASQIFLGPSETGYRLRYEVNGVWIDLPTPASCDGLITEIGRLAQLRTRARHWFSYALLRRALSMAAAATQVGYIELTLGANATMVSVSLETTNDGKAVTLRFPPCETLSLPASQVLQDFLRSYQRSPDDPGES